MARLGPCSAFSAHTYGRFFKNKHAFTAAPSTEAQLQTTEKRGQICTQITNIPLHWSVPGSPPGRSPGLPAGERGWSGRGAVSHPFRGRPRKLRRASQFPNLKSEVQNSVIQPSYGPFRAVFGVFRRMCPGFFHKKNAFTAAPSIEAQLHTTEKRGQICTQITNIPPHWSVPGSPPGRSPGLPAGERGWSGRGAVSHPFRGRPRKLRRASQFPNLKSEVQNSVIRPSYGPFRAMFGVFGAHIWTVF